MEISGELQFVKAFLGNRGNGAICDEEENILTQFIERKYPTHK